MSRTDKSGKQGGMDGLTTLTRQLAQLKQQTRALGIFTNDRELLECPSCGLLEDVTAEGVLVTDPNTSEEVNDSGLRFISPIAEIVEELDVLEEEAATTNAALKNILGKLGA